MPEGPMSQLGLCDPTLSPKNERKDGATGRIA